MERKLELKDICGYLPYGLCFEDGIKLTEYGILSNLNYLTHLAIILRPLSDLYCAITHNGKEIVPIVEDRKSTRLNSSH